MANSVQSILDKNNDPDFIKLKEYLEGCSQEEVSGIIAIMYIGKDISEGSQFPDPFREYQLAYRQYFVWRKVDIVRQIMGKTDLVEYLRIGSLALDM